MGLESIFLCIHGVGSRILGAVEVACKIYRQFGDIIKSQARIGFHYGNYSSWPLWFAFVSLKPGVVFAGYSVVVTIHFGVRAVPQEKLGFCS